MPINLSFGGATIKRPGAYSVVDTSGLVAAGTGSQRILAFVGVMDASATVAPKTPVYYNDPSFARKALKQGEVLEAAETAWRHGADVICFVRVDNATQATGSIKDSSNGTVFEIKARKYGLDGNNITYDVETDGSGNKTIVITEGNVVETYDTTGLSNQEVADLINKKSKLVTFKKKSDAVFVNPTNPTNLSGGTGGGTVTDQDWQEAIDALTNEPVKGIIPVSTNPAIILKVDAHVNLMSSVKNKKERRGFYGHEPGVDISEIIDLRMSINNERGVLASPAVYDYDKSGQKVVRSSVFLASAYAGLWASKEPQDTITYDYVKFAGLERHYTSLEIEKLLQNGVAVTEFVQGKGYRIVQGITTYVGEDLSQSELSVSTLKDIMSEDMRNYLEEKHVGKAGVAGIEITIRNDVVSRIERYLRNGWIAGYVAESIKITKDGTAFYVEWEGEPTLPINNFLITSHFTL